MKYITSIPLVFFIIVSLTCIVFSGIIKSVILLISLCVFFLLTIISLDIASIIIASFIPMNGILRFNDFDNPICAGYTTGLYILFLFGFFLKGLLKIRKQNIPLFFCFMCFIGILTIHITVNISNVGLFALMIREYLLPLMIILPFYEIIKRDKEKYIYIIQAIFFSTLFVAIINIIHYFIGLNIIQERFVIRTTINENEGIPTLRKIGPLVIPRLQHFLGLSNQGAGGVFYIIVFFLGVFANSIRQKIIYKIGCILLLIPAFFIASFSTIFTFLLLFIFLYVIRNQNTLYIKLFLCSFIFIMIIISPIMTVNISNATNGENLSILSYGFNSFIKPSVDIIMDSNFFENVFGAGLGLRSGNQLGMQIRNSRNGDRYLLVAYLQMGLIGFLSMIILWISAIPNLFDKRKYHEQMFVVSGIFLIGLFGYDHGAAPIERLFSPLFAIGLVFSMNSKKYSNYIVSSNQK